MKRLVHLGFLAASFLLASELASENDALAQASCAYPPAMGDGWASGSMSVARGTNDVIGCQVQVTSRWNHTAEIYCYARVAGVDRFCFSHEAALVAAVDSITPQSYLAFSWVDTECRDIVVQTFSCG